MLVTVLYAAATASLFATVVTWRLGTAFIYHVRQQVLFSLLHHLCYPIFLHRRWFWSSLTRWRVLWTVLYWTGNLICGLVDFHDGTKITNRTGVLAVLNLVPLVGFPNFAQISDYLGVQVLGFQAAHSAIGIVVLMQAITHIATQMQHSTLDLQNHAHFWGLLVRLRMTMAEH